MAPFPVASALLFALFGATNAQTSDTIIDSISPTAVTTGSTVSISFVSSDDFNSTDLLTFAANCSEVTPDINATAGANQTMDFVFTSGGTLKLCFTNDGESDSMEQTGIELNVTTGTGLITAVSPSSIVEGTTSDFALTGTVSTGDSAAFAADCSSVSDAFSPTVGTDATSTSISAPAASGTYKLCYQSSGTSEYVEQAGITVTVTAITAQPSVDMTVSFDITFNETEHSIDGAFATEFEAAVAAALYIPAEFVNVTDIRNGSVIVDFTAYAPAANVSAASSTDDLLQGFADTVQAAVEGGLIVIGNSTVDTTSFSTTFVPGTTEAPTTADPGIDAAALAAALAAAGMLLGILVLIIVLSVVGCCCCAVLVYCMCIKSKGGENNGGATQQV